MEPLTILERGDLDALRGTVVVYSSYSAGAPFEPLAPSILVGMFLTVHPDDFRVRAGVPPQPDEPPGVDEEARTLTVYGMSLELDAVAVSLITEEDALYAGHYADEEDCVIANHLAANLYMLLYKKQLWTEIRQRNARAESNAVDELLSAPVLAPQLHSLYIGPLLLALEAGDTGLASDVARRFSFRCGEVGPFSRDARALAELLSSPVDEAGLRLIHRYVDKILAIAGERFEDAARIRDEIALMERTCPEGAP